ncbi:MAG: flagellar basal body rod protein FlgC [Pirellulaceae bacterium]|jgi:flagellar basal-body rod protein FlgC|nr:flagellar basal body rod protein FlgC [Pirellulaceae bacterium]
MIPAIDISTSALVAQRTRMDVVSSNLANLQSQTRLPNGELAPYEGKFVIFETDDAVGTKDGAVGVRVARVDTEQVEPNYRWEPGHPLAIQEGPKKGYVAYPNINMTAEMVDALVAARAYEANLGAMEISKNMAQQSLRILG